jgi:hypothetical protein
MTVKGRIDCRIFEGETAPNEEFVTLYNFLNTDCASIGVTRIAYYAGASGSATMGYWNAGGADYSQAPGANAYALFRFGSATIPFYVLIQSVNARGSTYISYENTVTKPCGLSGSTATNTCNTLISFAMKLDGTSPWAGGTANAGADNKTSGSGAVWLAGASTLAAFPRCNSIGGNAAKAESMCQLSGYQIAGTGDDAYHNIITYGCRMHILADENNLLILSDTQANSTYSAIYFGKYIPRTDVTVQIPYVLLYMPVQSNSVLFPRFNYGVAASNNTTISFTAGGDGGIVHPVASNGVKICYLDYPSLFTDARFHSSKSVRIAGRYDTIPFWLGMNEGVGSYGLLGTTEFIRMCVNVPTHFTSDDRTVAVFGSANPLHAKLLVPWDGKTAPGSGITREGVAF